MGFPDEPGPAVPHNPLLHRDRSEEEFAPPPRARDRRPRKPRRADRSRPRPPSTNPGEGASHPQATVSAVLRGHCRLLLDEEEILCPLPAGVQAAPGDRVRLAPGPGAPRVLEVLPRTSTLWRPSPSSPEKRKLLAANVDLGVVVVTSTQPPLRLGLVDRFLLRLQAGGIRPAICLNKIDLADPDEPESEVLEAYREQGIPVLACSASTGQGIPELRTLLEGHTAVLLGHSGVGKTSLTAALGGPTRPTARLRKGDRRGRHCTTTSNLARLGPGTWLLDTPGLRELGTEDLSTTEIAEGFGDLLQHAENCRFRDCTHLIEPDCDVRRAVREGALPRFRYQSYQRLVEGEQGESADSFRCARCGEVVPTSGGGTRHRNHCPRCLHSRHLDNRPGDREACCAGVMDPVAVWVRSDGEWALIHRCRECGALSSNRIASDDNEMLLLSLAVRPLSSPPFPLERLA